VDWTHGLALDLRDKVVVTMALVVLLLLLLEAQEEPLVVVHDRLPHALWGV
jgi:hypothetical protein